MRLKAGWRPVPQLYPQIGNRQPPLCFFWEYRITRLMGKKSAKDRHDQTFKFRCRQADLESFKKAAEAEGFNSASGWVLYHLRKQAKETIRREGRGTG